jgi:hypothetical protein
MGKGGQVLRREGGLIQATFHNAPFRELPLAAVHHSKNCALMSQMGLGCAKTPTQISLINCISESQIIRLERINACRIRASELSCDCILAHHKCCWLIAKGSPKRAQLTTAIA